MTRNPQKYRRMIEERLGRPLRSRHDGDPEQVHHINGDDTDDRWENLVVCSAAEHYWIHYRDDIGPMILERCQRRQGWGSA